MTSTIATTTTATSQRRSGPPRRRNSGRTQQPLWSETDYSPSLRACARRRTSFGLAKYVGTDCWACFSPSALEILMTCDIFLPFVSRPACAVPQHRSKIPSGILCISKALTTDQQGPRPAASASGLSHTGPEALSSLARGNQTARARSDRKFQGTTSSRRRISSRRRRRPRRRRRRWRRRGKRGAVGGRGSSARAREME